MISDAVVYSISGPIPLLHLVVIYCVELFVYVALQFEIYELYKEMMDTVICCLLLSYLHARFDNSLRKL